MRRLFSRLLPLVPPWMPSSRSDPPVRRKVEVRDRVVRRVVERLQDCVRGVFAMRRVASMSEHVRSQETTRASSSVFSRELCDEVLSRSVFTRPDRLGTSRARKQRSRTHMSHRPTSSLEGTRSAAVDWPGLWASGGPLAAIWLTSEPPIDHANSAARRNGISSKNKQYPQQGNTNAICTSCADSLFLAYFLVGAGIYGDSPGTQLVTI